MRPSKRASKGVQVDAKKPGWEADTPAPLSLPWRTSGKAAGREWNGSEKQRDQIAARVIMSVI